MTDDTKTYRVDMPMGTKEVCISTDKKALTGKERVTMAHALQLIGQSLHYTDQCTAALIRHSCKDSGSLEAYSETAHFARDSVLFDVCDGALHGKGDEHATGLSVELAHFQNEHIGDQLKMMIYAGICLRQRGVKRLAQLKLTKVGCLRCLFEPDTPGSKTYKSVAAQRRRDTLIT
jgi:hypothetical protein